MNSYGAPTSGGDVNGYARPPESQPEERRKQFTVDEALQRTPLTSINPFDPATIPLLQAAPPTLTSNVMTSHERSSGRAHLDHLDRLAQELHNDKAAHELESKLHDLKWLLTERDYMQYEFRPLSLSQAQRSTAAHPTPANTTSTFRSPAPKLGAFAGRLLESGAFTASFRYPTPNSPSTSPAHRDPSPQKRRRTSGQLSPQQSNLQAVARNARLPTTQAPITPSRSPSIKSPQSTPAVMIPPPPLESSQFALRDAQADEQLLRQFQETKIKREKERERASAQADEVLRDVDIDQKERAQAALETLQQTFAPILEAEERIENESSTSKHVQLFFQPCTDGSSLILNGSALSNIDSALAKAVGTKQMSKVPLELLARIQKLCAKVILSAIDDDTTFPDDPSDDSLQRWSATIPVAENTTAAARTLLRTMTAGRTDKELFPEETLSQLLDNFRQVTESCVAPIAEIKASSDTGRAVCREKSVTRSLSTISQRAGRILKLLGDLLLSSELSEMAVTKVDYICTKLIFVANTSSEKESILGVSRFETVRRSAMDCLARVFLRLPSQRKSILDEILSSLEKLPVARQNARHFKIVDGKPIQLVSALILQLIQTTATYIPAKESRSKFKQSKEESETDRDSESEGSPTKRSTQARRRQNELQTPSTSENADDNLVRIGKPLWGSVHANASHVTQYLVVRALKSSKTSDEPYRNLLDIFTEDFVSVLGHTDWPAAEIVLQSLLANLFGIAEGEKTGAPAKNMALDLMGVMGSGIADLKRHFDHLLSGIANEDDSQAQRLAEICRNYVENPTNEAELMSLGGPYRLLTDYLGYRGSDDVQIQNARNYHLLRWSQALWARDRSPATPTTEDKEPLGSQTPPSDELFRWLATSIQEPAVPVDNSQQVATSVARTACVLVTLQMTFCKAIKPLFNILLRSMSSAHATTRSRGLKSVIQILEKDPSMLDSNVNFVKHINYAATDQSTLVRDAALQLIGRCITLRPDIEEDFLETMLNLTADPTVGIRKRSIRQLKETYLRKKDDSTRVRVASVFLRRMNDEEEAVTDLARQTLEEMWIDPYPTIDDEGRLPLAMQQELNRHAAQLVKIAEQSENVLQAFEPFFRALLISTHKNAKNNRGVCKAIAGAAFDNFIENDQQRSVDARANILALLSVLTRAQADLLSLDQLKMLETYTSTLKTGADLRLYKPVAQIYHAAMPCFAATEQDFVTLLQSNMINSLTKISNSDLMDEVTSCLWAMQPVLKNRFKLFNATQQMLKMLVANREAEPNKVLRFVKMIGHFGKAWNLDEYVSRFQVLYDWWRGERVSELLVSILLPSTDAKYQLEIRKGATESICLISLSWPENYLRKDVLEALETSLRSGDAQLEQVVVSGLRDFFKACEGHTKSLAETHEGETNGDSTQKLGTSMRSSDSDKAGSLLAQQFFVDVERIALRYTNEVAFAATELICSTSRQGVIHPRQTGCILVALETSPNQAIAKTALDEHMVLNSKHESILEKEYVKAVEMTFAYQRDTARDSSGLRLQPVMAPKLGPFFEVLKSASITTRKKLLPNLCKRLDVQVSKLDALPKLEMHLLFAKFVCQNLALGSFSRVEEVTLMCAALEGIFSTTGNALSQRLEPLLSAEGANVSEQEGFTQLTLAAMLMSLLWRTRSHLRAVYTNIPTASGKQDKRLSKDTSKPPLKSTSAAKLEENFVKTTETVGALANEQSMREQCHVFMDLLSVDHEARIGNSSDEVDGREGTPEADRKSAGTPSLPPSGAFSKGTKRRRSESGSAVSTPNGRKRGRPKLDKRRSSGVKKFDPDDEGWE